MGQPRAVPTRQESLAQRYNRCEICRVMGLGDLDETSRMLAVPGT
jgi:hypothetical protein